MNPVQFFPRITNRTPDWSVHSAFDDGTPWILFGKRDGIFWLRFPDLVDFAIQPSQWMIVAYALRQATCPLKPSLTHLLLDQVLSRVAAREDAPVLHASGWQPSFASV